MDCLYVGLSEGGIEETVLDRFLLGLGTGRLALPVQATFPFLGVLNQIREGGYRHVVIHLPKDHALMKGAHACLEVLLESGEIASGEVVALVPRATSLQTFYPAAIALRKGALALAR